MSLFVSLFNFLTVLQQILHSCPPFVLLLFSAHDSSWRTGIYDCLFRNNLEMNSGILVLCVILHVSLLLQSRTFDTNNTIISWQTIKRDLRQEGYKDSLWTLTAGYLFLLKKNPWTLGCRTSCCVIKWGRRWHFLHFGFHATSEWSMGKYEEDAQELFKKHRRKLLRQESHEREVTSSAAEEEGTFFSVKSWRNFFCCPFSCFAKKRRQTIKQQSFL